MRVSLAAIGDLGATFDQCMVAMGAGPGSKLTPGQIDSTRLVCQDPATLATINTAPYVIDPQHACLISGGYDLANGKGLDWPLSRVDALFASCGAAVAPHIYTYAPRAQLYDVTSGARISGLGATGFNVGDAFVVSITGGAPNSPVTVSQNGSAPFTMGQTDANGNWQTSGNWAAGDVGQHSQVWAVAGTQASPGINFNVAAAPAPKVYTPDVHLSVSGATNRTVYAPGDSFTLAIYNGPPNSPVTGQSEHGTAQVGTSAADGSFSISGTWTAADIGTHAQTWFIGSFQASPTLQFTIAAPAPIYVPHVSLKDTTTGASLSGGLGSLGVTGFNSGDAFTFQITGGPPNSVVTVRDNGGSSAAMGYTDGSGNWTVSGSWAAENVGVHSEEWMVGDVVVNPSPLTFAVNAATTAPTTTDSGSLNETSDFSVPLVLGGVAAALLLFFRSRG